MALNLSVLNNLQPVTPDLLRPYQTLATLKTQQLQQQDIAAQVQERQAQAQQQQQALQQGQAAQKIIMDHLRSGGEMDDSLIKKLYGAGLTAHAEGLQKSMDAIAKGKSERENIQSEVKTREQNAATEASKAQEGASNNLFERTFKENTQKRQQAEEAAGVIVPNTEVYEGGQKFAQFKVRQPDGSYTYERRSLGKAEAPPKALTPGVDVPFSPEVTQNRKDIAAANKVDPSQMFQGNGPDGKPAWFIFDKKSQSAKMLQSDTGQAITPAVKPLPVPAPIQQNVNVAGKALDQSKIIRGILEQHPEMVGPFMGRLSEFAQGVGSNPFAGNPKLEELGATLSGHLRYLFAQELKNAIGSRPGEMLARELKEASPQRKQDINLLKGFLDSVENNANVTLRAAKTQYGYNPFNLADESSGTTPSTADDFLNRHGAK